MQLIPHPQSPPTPVEAIHVLVTRLSGGKISLVFNVTGDICSLRLPPVAPPQRVDGLWRHTCFEAFVQSVGARGYVELNLAPSGSWAAYQFDSYRSGVAPADLPCPVIKTGDAPRHFGLVAGIEFGAVPELSTGEDWNVGLSAVIEAEDGSLSYWALAHGDGPPDFHNRDCFTAHLPPVKPA